jgi:hypothetical protein
LETLNNFLQTNKLNKRVIVITPVGSDIFNKWYSRTLYLKAFDYFHTFPMIKYDFSEFVQRIFKEDIQWNILKEFLQEISKNTESINIRIIKHCIREANLKYIQFKKKYFWVNFEIFLMVELSRFLIIKNWDKTESLFETYKRWENINNKCFEALLISMMYSEDSLYDEGNKLCRSDEKIRHILFWIDLSQSIHEKRLEWGKYNLVVSNVYLDGVSEQEKELQLNKMSWWGGFKAIQPNPIEFS